MNMNKITRLGLILVSIGLVAFVPDVQAGGRTFNTGDVVSRQAVFTAWQRDNVIHVAARNVCEKDLKLRVALGVLDKSPIEYAAQEMSLPVNALKIANFPIHFRKTVRGDNRFADHVFLSTNGQALGDVHVQKTDSGVFLDQYVAAVGDVVRFFYLVQPANSLRAILVESTAGTGKQNVLQGRPPAFSVPPVSVETIQALNLPQSTENMLLKHIDKSFVFVFQPGEGGVLSMEYNIGAIDHAASVTIHYAEHILRPAGGGGGKGQSVLVFDPKQTKIRSSVPPAQPGGKASKSLID